FLNAVALDGSVNVMFGIFFIASSIPFRSSIRCCFTSESVISGWFCWEVVTKLFAPPNVPAMYFKLCQSSCPFKISFALQEQPENPKLSISEFTDVSVVTPLLFQSTGMPVLVKCIDAGPKTVVKPGGVL